MRFYMVLHKRRLILILDKNNKKAKDCNFVHF